MTFLVTAIASDAEHMPSLLYTLRGVLLPEGVPSSTTNAAGGEDAEADLWGVGYYADDQALTIRKPGDLLQERTVYGLASSIRSQVAVALVKTDGGRPAHAPPHRFRRWLFGVVGDVEGLSAFDGRIKDALPDFIRTEIAGANSSELAFAMVLKALHDKNLLNEASPKISDQVDALDRAVDAMKMLTAEAGQPPPTPTLLLTQGRQVLVVRRGGPEVFFRRHNGLEAQAAHPQIQGFSDVQAVAEVLKRFRAVVICSSPRDPGTDWIGIPDGQHLMVDRRLEIRPSWMSPID